MTDRNKIAQWHGFNPAHSDHRRGSHLHRIRVESQWLAQQAPDGASDCPSMSEALPQSTASWSAPRSFDAYFTSGRHLQMRVDLDGWHYCIAADPMGHDIITAFPTRCQLHQRSYQAQLVAVGGAR